MEEPAATEIVVTEIVEEPAATEIVVTKIVEEPTVTEIIVTQIVEEPVTTEIVEDTPTALPSDTSTPEPSDTPTLEPSNTPTFEPSDTPMPEPTETDAGEAILSVTPIAPSPSPTRTTILPPDFGRWIPIFLGLALLAAGTIAGVGLVAYLLFRGTPPGGAGQPPDRPPRQPTPLPPFLPPVRLMDVWLSEGGSGKGRVLQPGNRLTVGREYSLHVQLRLRGERRRRPRGYPREDIALNVVMFAPQTDFAIPERTGRISLPVDASSETLIRPLRPQRSGRLQVRACVYYGNLLLQSAVLEAPVGRREVGRLTRRIDYVASGTFSRLGFLSQPSLSLFTNQAPDGTHWLGIFSASTPSGSLLRQGDLQQFPADYLSSRAERARQSLSRIQGEEVYRLKNNLPLDERALQVHARDLVDLARQGTLLYNDLFGCDPDGSRGRARVTALRQLLQEPGLVSIARCRRDSLSMPWGMLYSLPLRVEPDVPLQVCPLYLQHLRANEWIPGQEQLSYQSDLLDDLPGCLTQNGCPRQGSEAYQTVCPFGFLGLTHQIEQPIQLIEPFPTDQTPPKIIEQRLDTNTRILRKTGEAVRVGLGAYAGFRALPRHRQALEALSPVLKLEYAEDREQVWKLLQKGDQHFFYFFCHGVVDQNNTFQLMIGQPDKPGFISASSLTPPIIQWPAEPRPLVVLNGCETAALKAELLGVFMDNLRFIGALGVVGTEIKVKTELAFAFGLPWMRALLSGQPAGQAMLSVRRHLERQGNPLGLAYSLYAPAGLHLHEQSGCATCMILESVS
ncbi:MAG: CHAT domain-containing protein [Anaerolineales bacterium]